MSNDNVVSENTEKRPEESFDTVGFLLDILAHWKWVLLSVILGVGIAYFYCATVMPTYQVDAKIYLNNQSSSTSNSLLFDEDSKFPFGTMFNGQPDQTEIQILKSRNNLVKIVDSLDLQYAYYKEGKLRDEPLYRDEAITASLDSASLHKLKSPITITVEKNGNKYDITAKTLVDQEKFEKAYTANALPYTVDVPTGKVVLSLADSEANLDYKEKIVISNPLAAADAISESLTIDFVKDANPILDASINTNNVQKGEDILSTLIIFYNRRLLEDQNRSAIQTEAFILDRLGMISGELKDVEERLREYRLAHNISDVQAQTAMNLTQRSETQSALADVDAEIRLISEAESQIRQQGSAPTTIGAVTKDNAINSEIANYNKLVANYELLSRDLTDESDQLVAIRSKLQEQRSTIMRSLSSAKTGLGQRRGAIASIGGGASAQLSSQPTVDKGLQEIFREQSVKDNIYTFLLQKREEIAIQKTLATPVAQFINNPKDEGQKSPRRMLILAVGFLLGLFVPTGIIYLRRTISPKFKDKEELAKVTSIPIIGEINQDDSKDPVVVGENVNSSIAELFRLLRNNINFTVGGAFHKVILMTSTISGEGKTFISLNLAMTYALTGKKILVIGLDIRRPVLARTCGFTNETGVTTYLSGQESDINSLIKKSPFNDNLDVLPAGPIPPNPNELLMSDRMAEMFKTLREEYDYIIVDSAPIGLVSDSLLIAPYSDVQIYVSRANYTTKKALVTLSDAVKSGRLPHAYILINGVNMNSGTYMYRRYGYSYGYGAKHGYGYGYGENQHRHKKKGIFGRKSRR